METFFSTMSYKITVVLLFSKAILKKKTYTVTKIKGFSDVFIKEILKIWSETSYEDNLNSIEHFLSMSLWHNSLMRIGNGPVYYKEWYVKGISKVSHHYSNEGCKHFPFFL